MAKFVTLHRPSLARLKSMNLILVHAVSVGRRGAEQAIKRLSLESWNAREKSTRRSSQMPPKSGYRLRFGARYPSTPSSIRTAGEATLGWWMWGMRNAFGYIMEKTNLPAVIAISMALNHFGHMLIEGSQSLMVFSDKRFIYTSRNVNSNLIIERKTSMI